jgi:hypothetical protein
MKSLFSLCAGEEGRKKKATTVKMRVTIPPRKRRTCHGTYRTPMEYEMTPAPPPTEKAVLNDAIFLEEFELSRSFRTPMPDEKKNAEPSPTKNRENRNTRKSGENMERITDTDIMSMPLRAVFLDPILAARIPDGTWNIAVPIRNAESIIPENDPVTL